MGNELFDRLQKPAKREKQPKPVKQLGKVGKQRQADRRAKLKSDPPSHEGYYECYLCHRWFERVELEHVEDASTHPELRHVTNNHRWACQPCNLAKKRRGGV